LGSGIRKKYNGTGGGADIDPPAVGEFLQQREFKIG